MRIFESHHRKTWLLGTQAALLLALLTPANAQIEVVTRPGDNLTRLLQLHGASGPPNELRKLIDITVRDNQHAFRNGDPDRLIPDVAIVLPLAKPPTPAPPEPPPEPGPVAIGMVEVIKGTTDILRGVDTITVIEQAPLYVDDRIITAAASRARLDLEDGSRLDLGPSTVFIVEQYQRPVVGDPGRLLLNLLKGAVRTISGLIGKRSGSVYQLRTATATIGIRGTEYLARFCSENCGDLRGASVGVADGAVVLQNDAGEVQLNPGEFGRAESATDVPASAPLPEGFFDIERDVSTIAAERTWLQKLLGTLRSLFE